MKYPVYPEPDGYDRPVNPYGDHITAINYNLGLI
jgi:hypothetical protein